MCFVLSFMVISLGRIERGASCLLSYVPLSMDYKPQKQRPNRLWLPDAGVDDTMYRGPQGKAQGSGQWKSGQKNNPV